MPDVPGGGQAGAERESGGISRVPRGNLQQLRRPGLPFQPRNDRPVYCSTCFDKVRASTGTDENAPTPA